MNIYIYGPPGSGKTTLGKVLAKELDIPFIDLDIEITRLSGLDIPSIFKLEGEAGFRLRELEVLKTAASKSPSVIALGGGALLNPTAREVVEKTGKVVCLQASLNTILSRLDHEGHGRPLLEGDTRDKLSLLLDQRYDHYESFTLRLQSEGRSLDDLIFETKLLIGAYRVKGMGSPYDVMIDPGNLNKFGNILREHEAKGPIVIISDRNVEKIYRSTVAESLINSGYEYSFFAILPGEEHKNIHTVIEIWNHLIDHRIERSSTIIALGGGVVGDMTGFAAATFLRGLPWINIPTTLLAMIDSSLGGKTGIDLPHAKNMVGAFYPPKLVFADPSLVTTLPVREMRNGLAEVVKHGIIGDPELFDLCSTDLNYVIDHLDWIVRRGMAVKLKIIEIDPYEKDRRQALNLGHTVGHAVELVSKFQLSHGESVAIGIVAETRIAEIIGMADKGLSNRIISTLNRLGLPTEIPDDIPLEEIIRVMQHDKKRLGGVIRFALPESVGKVNTGIVIENWPEMIRTIRNGVIR